MKKTMLITSLMLTASFAFAGNGQVGSVGVASMIVIQAKTMAIALPGADFQELLVEGKGQTLAYNESLDKTLVEQFVNSGFAAAGKAKDGIQVSDCEQALIVLSVGKGNVLPLDNGEESYRYPKVISFTCLKK